ncbi:MAG TPA: hypothetical protein VFT27_04845 [Actinomycetota bacterium]|nr:hypothetical protein [Actinomycetota bacterium]
MLRNVRVWAVELSEGVAPSEREGHLWIDVGELRFEPSGEGQAGIAIPFHEVRKVRRLRGSPVLMVVRRGGDRETRTAFYFVQPPPLAAFTDSQTDIRSVIPFRNPKRKARRENVGYLGLMNREKKAELIEWEREVRAAVAAAADS